MPGATVPETNIVTLGEDVVSADVWIWLGPLNDAVTPEGAENVTETGEAKLSSELTYRDTVPDAPWGIEMPEVENAREKSP